MMDLINAVDLHNMQVRSMTVRIQSSMVMHAYIFSLFTLLFYRFMIMILCCLYTFPRRAGKKGAARFDKGSSKRYSSPF